MEFRIQLRKPIEIWFLLAEGERKKFLTREVRLNSDFN